MQLLCVKQAAAMQISSATFSQLTQLQSSTLLTQTLTQDLIA